MAFRSTVRVRAPPGGASSIIFGNEDTAGSSSNSAAQRPKTPLSEPLRLRLRAAETVEDVVDMLQGVLPPSQAAVATSANDASGRAASVTRGGSTHPATQLASEGMQALRDALKRHGVHGIISMGKRFKIMDDDNDGKISEQEFRKAMVELKIDPRYVNAVFRHIDANCDGHLSYDELLVAIRGALNPRRKEIVRQAFKVFDQDGSGRVTLADLKERYSASQHPDVITGKKTEEEVLGEFLETFDTIDKDGVVTLEEFLKYYENISASVDGDDYFELVVRNAWHISGGEGWCENTTCRRLLVVHEDGSQTVEEVTNDFDIGANDTEAMKKNLAERGINATKVFLYGGFDGTSADGGGGVKAARNRQLRSSIVF